MKKIISVLMVCAILFSLCACGKSVPETVSDKTLKIGSKAIDIMDSYLNGKTDIESLIQKMDPVIEDMSSEYERLEEEEDNHNFPDGSDEALNISLRSLTASTARMLMTQFVLGAFYDAGIGTDNYDCQKVRNQLYDWLYPEG